MSSRSEASPADVEAVTRVVTEYFQSWFAGDGERIRACLHPHLAKRTPRKPGTELLALHEARPSRLSLTRPAVRAPRLIRRKR
jgi:Putative lumazine-binding